MNRLIAPSLADVVWPRVAYTVTSAPLVVAVIGVGGAPADLDHWLVVVAGLLFGVASWLPIRHLRGFSRWYRRPQLIARVLGGVIYTGLAVTIGLVWGRALAELWASFPLGGALLYVGANAVQVFSVRGLHGGRWRRVTGAVLLPVSTVIGSGVLVVLVTLAAPDRDTTVTAVVLALLSAIVGWAFYAGFVGVLGWPLGRWTDALANIVDPRQRDQLLGCWASDSVARRRRDPDMLVVWQLAAAANDPGIPGLAEFREQHDFTDVSTCRDYLVESAQAAISLVEEDVLPYLLAGHDGPVRRSVDAARGVLHTYRARIAEQQRRFDQQAEWLTIAVESYRAAGMPNHAALQSCKLAILALHRRERADLTLAIVRPMSTDRSLSRLVRVHAADLVALAGEAGSTQPLRFTRWGCWQVSRELPRAVRRAWGGSERLETEMVVRHTRWLTADVGGRTEEPRWPNAHVPDQVWFNDEAPRRWRRVQRKLEARPDIEPVPLDKLAWAERIGATGDTTTAHDLGRQVLERAIEHHNLLTAVEASEFLARLHHTTGDRHRVLRYALRMIDLQEESRLSITDAAIRPDTEGMMFDEAIELLATGESADEPPARTAFRLVEQARSRALLDVIAEHTELTAPAGVAPLIEAERRALAVYRTAQATAKDTVRHRQEVARARAELSATWQRLTEAGTEGVQYLHARRGRPVDLDGLRRTVRAAVGAPPTPWVLFEFFMLRNDIVVVVVRDDRPGPVLVTVPRDPRLDKAVEWGLPDAEGGLREDEWGRALAPLAAAIREHSDEGDLVLLVPHKTLHYVPLHAIPVDDEPLTVRNPACYSPSASVLAYCAGARRTPSGRSLVLADTSRAHPLAFARQEARAVVQLAGGRPAVLTGERATRSALVERLSGNEFDVVHLACHAVFDRETPLESGVELAGRDVWTVRDILALRFHADLVTLSACTTALSRFRGNDQHIGLAHALLHAGARTVLVTLWSVDDLSTCLLMEAFYAYLRSGWGKAEALRTAQMLVRDITAASVIRYCETIRSVSGDDDGHIARNIAGLRVAAGDLAGAADDYERMAETSRFDAGERAELAKGARALRRLSQRAGLPDYDHRPYRPPYFWAAFTLVGDWR